MTSDRRCVVCSKPEFIDGKHLTLFESGNSLDLGGIPTQLYCADCFEEDREPLWMWMQRIERLKGPGNVRDYLWRKCPSWTGSYVNGHEIGKHEIVDFYRKEHPT